MRRVIVFSTLTNQKQIINIDGNVRTWGDLNDQINGYSADLRAVISSEGTGKVGVHDNSTILPESDFKVFLAPSKVKSGGMSLYEALEMLQGRINEAFDEVLEQIEIEGEDCVKTPSGDSETDALADEADNIFG